MSNVPKLQQALKSVRQARARVAELTKGESSAGARIKTAQVRTNYVETKGAQNPQDQKGNKEIRINDRRSSSRPSGGNTASRKGNQMVSKLGGRLSTTQLFQNISASHHARHEEDHPYDKEPEGLPVAYGTKAHLLDPKTEDSLEAIMTPYGPGVKMRGKEFLSVISSDANPWSGGNAIIALPLNPRLLELPRLSIMSQLYTRFLFNKFNLHYTKSAGTQNNGSLQIFGVYDPTINPCVRPGETLIAYAAQRGSTDLSLYQDAILTMDDSHFKDLLFLQPDDDLRWTMQGVVFVIASGSIVAGLEAGKIMLEYEVTLCNDDLDQNANIMTRNYRNTNLTFATTPAAGNRVSGTTSVPNGKYFVSFRTNPSVAFSVYKDLDSYNQNDATKVYSVIQGFGCYAVVAAGAFRLMYGPDLYAEDSSVTTFNKLLITAGYTGTPIAAVDMYRYSDE